VVWIPIDDPATLPPTCENNFEIRESLNDGSNDIMMFDAVRIFNRRPRILVGLLLLIFAPFTSAQIPGGPVQEQKKQEQNKKDEESESPSHFPEIEFVASNKFRSLGYIQPVLKQGANFEVHYFGIDGADVAVVNGSWTFRAGKHLKLTPGLGVYFGEHQKTSPAIAFRWEIETRRVFSQGLFLQSLGKNENFEEEEQSFSGVRPSIWDGNHVSLRYKRWEIGPLWERIHGREGNEWKGGMRTAFRFWRYVSGLLVIVGPDAEVRGGFIVSRPPE